MEQITTPLKAIRKKCLRCLDDRRDKEPEDPAKDVKLCLHPSCELYHLRFGKNPETVVPGASREEAVSQMRRYGECMKARGYAPMKEPYWPPDWGEKFSMEK